MLALLVAPLFIAASAVAHPAVAHPAIVRRGDVSLSNWSSQQLEPYWSFKNRYASLNCASQTGTDFYTSCCYPLGASESLSSRPAECTPATLSCSAPASTTPTPTPAASSTNNDDVYDESSLPWCEAGDDGYDNDGDDTYTDAAYNSPNTYTPPTTTTAYSQSQPTGNSGDNSGNNNNNNGGNNSGSTTTASSGNNGGSSGGSSGSAITGGMATYYYQNGNPGACGDYHSDSDFIGAIDIAWWGAEGQRSQYCGRNVQITNLNNGKTVTIVVADECPTCATDNSFDLSLGAFQALDSLSTGTFPISWTFV